MTRSELLVCAHAAERKAQGEATGPAAALCDARGKHEFGVAMADVLLALGISRWQDYFGFDVKGNPTGLLQRDPLGVARRFRELEELQKKESQHANA